MGVSPLINSCRIFRSFGLIILDLSISAMFLGFFGLSNNKMLSCLLITYIIIQPEKAVNTHGNVPKFQIGNIVQIIQGRAINWWIAIGHSYGCMCTHFKLVFSGFIVLVCWTFTKCFVHSDIWINFLILSKNCTVSIAESNH